MLLIRITLYSFTHRFVNLKSLSIEASGAVVCSTSFTNNSDTKLKDNQQIANLDEIQNIFNKINVKTSERNDLQNQKRVGFIAQDFDKVLPEYFKHSGRWNYSKNRREWSWRY